MVLLLNEILLIHRIYHMQFFLGENGNSYNDVEPETKD